MITTVNCTQYTSVVRIIIHWSVLVAWYVLLTLFSTQLKRAVAVKYILKVKVKGAVPQWGLGRVLISQTLAVEPVGGWTTESVTHGQYDARPTAAFPAAERHCPLAGTKLYCLVTEAHGCEQLAQSCYLVADWPGVELVTFRSRANLPMP